MWNKASQPPPCKTEHVKVYAAAISEIPKTTVTLFLYSFDIPFVLFFNVYVTQARFADSVNVNQTQVQTLRYFLRPTQSCTTFFYTGVIFLTC